MKVAFYTLGCKVNMYETEYLMNEFNKRNYDIISNTDLADVYVINTCTVTNSSDIKSKKLIRKAIKQNKNAIIVVMGCLSQYRHKELADIRDINILIGNKDKSKVVDYIEEYIKNKERIIKIYDLSNQQFESMEIDKFFNKTRAFVKIQDGCNNYCSYCIIPYVRGNVRSKPKEDVIKEITNLVHNGYIEIVLSGIHTGSYGSDLSNYSFAMLLQDIVKIHGLKRLRISSIEITELNNDILELIKKYEVIVDHLHIPLQSGSDKILKLMNRKYDTKYFRDIITKIRNIKPDISITTDVIVGFPNETDQDFNDTVNYINDIKFSKLHVFPYSKRDNTKAIELHNHIDESIKKIRVNKLVELSKELEKEYMDKFLNKETEVLIEKNDKNYSIGHTTNYLLVKINQQLCSGLIVKVKLLEVAYPYIIAKID